MHEEDSEDLVTSSLNGSKCPPAYFLYVEEEQEAEVVSTVVNKRASKNGVLTSQPRASVVMLGKWAQVLSSLWFLKRNKKSSLYPIHVFLFYFIFKYFLYLNCVCARMCLCMCVYVSMHLYVQVHSETKKGFGVPGTWVIDTCKMSDMDGENWT